VEPFKGLLLGLFFISVGMAVDFGVLRERPLVVAAIIAALFLLKGAVLWLIARRARLAAAEQPLFILLLAQGGEFAFVLLGPAVAGDALPPASAQAAILAVALSMLATPFLLLLHDRLLLRWMRSEKRAAEKPQPGSVIVAGLGRVGQVVARLLNAAGCQLTVLDDDPDHVAECRKLGFRVFYGDATRLDLLRAAGAASVFYGDATRLDLLRAAGAASAGFLIITLDQAAAISHLARSAKKHFPGLRIVARAHDMRHLFELRDLGVEVIERETWLSALQLGEKALAAIGGDAGRAAEAARTFAEHDEEVLSRLYEVHRSAPESHVAVSNELRDQLARTLPVRVGEERPERG
jgi:glutathione-regulated potassium-efflux system ancillary protein KefC